MDEVKSASIWRKIAASTARPGETEAALDKLLPPGANYTSLSDTNSVWSITATFPSEATANDWIAAMETGHHPWSDVQIDSLSEDDIHHAITVVATAKTGGDFLLGAGGSSS